MRFYYSDFEEALETVLDFNSLNHISKIKFIKTESYVPTTAIKFGDGWPGIFMNKRDVFALLALCNLRKKNLIIRLKQTSTDELLRSASLISDAAGNAYDNCIL